MTILLDNYDSFTYNLYDYLRQLNQEVVVIQHDEKPIEWFDEIAFEQIILSPGPKRPKEAGMMMDLIEKFHTTKPMLGICLGHQGLGEFFGANLSKAVKPIHGKSSMIYHQQHPLFNNIPNPFPAMRYHSLIVDDRAAELEVIARSEIGEVMSFAHRKYPIAGIQFHPESILTPNGLGIIANWNAWIKVEEFAQLLDT